jgi:hypothetical protein
LGISKMDKNKCPKIEMPKYFAQKATLCDHKLFLWSGYQKNNFQNVIIIFLYIFEKKDLALFYVNKI